MGSQSYLPCRASLWQRWTDMNEVLKNLFDSLYKTSQKKGVRGIHFVDEALPPSQLVEFGKLNVKCENPLYFWGNVRFEKTFSYDIASFLSYAGLGGVSAGIEVATSKGLANIHKGTWGTSTSIDFNNSSSSRIYVEYNNDQKAVYIADDQVSHMAKVCDYVIIDSVINYDAIEGKDLLKDIVII